MAFIYILDAYEERFGYSLFGGPRYRNLTDELEFWISLEHRLFMAPYTTGYDREVRYAALGQVHRYIRRYLQS